MLVHVDLRRADEQREADDGHRHEHRAGTPAPARLTATPTAAENAVADTLAVSSCQPATRPAAATPTRSAVVDCSVGKMPASARPASEKRTTATIGGTMGTAANTTSNPVPEPMVIRAGLSPEPRRRAGPC